MFDNRTKAEIAEQEAAEQNAAIMQAKEDR
jgi:hypothetical protein